MTSLLLLAWVLGTASPPASIRVEADSAVFSEGGQTVTGRGRAVLRTRDAVIRADELVYHHREQRLEARGRVTWVSGMFAATAERLEVDLVAMEADIEGGRVLQ